jgi:putative ABC transport system substrate-binding protein
MSTFMRRRSFLTLLGVSAAAWPLTARAQQRRIGVLVNWSEGDAESMERLAAFTQHLEQLGWTEGHNLRLERRFAGSTNERYRLYANELVALAPDVILAAGGSILNALLQASRMVPIVFANAIDPVGAGFVESLARPGGNATGFASTEFGISAKWLELLKEIAPRVNRVAVIRNATIAGGGQFGAIQSAAPAFGVELRPIEPRDTAEIERAITAFVRGPNDGLIVTGSSAAIAHRQLIVSLAARYQLPAVYSSRLFASSAGGLISYRFDPLISYRLSAGYVNRILRGEKAADLPVQAPTKYETVLNLKTAKTLGLDVPTSILLRADEVIE